ncbi:DNA glycosylase AlkZ-like family protein [Nonomuraea jiangxiensis]
MAEVVHRLGGLQAQEPRPPYLGIWARLEGFARDDLHAALHARTLVRATMWRATLHLVTAADFAAFRPVLRPVLAPPRPPTCRPGPAWVASGPS